MRVEREHAERLVRREQRLMVEKRLDRYRQSTFTVSGRPYDSLPVVSLDKLRKDVFKENRRSVLALGARSEASALSNQWM